VGLHAVREGELRRLGPAIAPAADSAGTQVVLTGLDRGLEVRVALDVAAHHEVAVLRVGEVRDAVLAHALRELRHSGLRRTR
jgi:hypothetical protein